MQPTHHFLSPELKKYIASLSPEAIEHPPIKKILMEIFARADRAESDPVKPEDLIPKQPGANTAGYRYANVKRG